jgi:hypothetical protein
LFAAHDLTASGLIAHALASFGKLLRGYRGKAMFYSLDPAIPDACASYQSTGGDPKFRRGASTSPRPSVVSGKSAPFRAKIERIRSWEMP